MLVAYVGGICRLPTASPKRFTGDEGAVAAFSLHPHTYPKWRVFHSPIDLEACCYHGHVHRCSICQIRANGLYAVPQYMLARLLSVCSSLRIAIFSLSRFPELYLYKRTVIHPILAYGMGAILL